MDRYELMSRIVCPPSVPRAVIDEAILRTDDDEKASYSWSPKLPARVLCGALGAAAFVAAGLLPLALAQKGIFCAMAVAALMAAACDVKKKIIPWQLCAAIGVLAVAWQVLAGFAALGLAVLLAALLTLLFTCAGAIAARLGSADSIGGGDLRMIGPVVLACGWPGVVWGGVAALAFSLAALVALAATGKLHRRTKVPFGPTLAVWLVVGMLLGALVPT